MAKRDHRLIEIADSAFNSTCLIQKPRGDESTYDTAWTLNVARLPYSPMVARLQAFPAGASRPTAIGPLHC